MAHRVLCNILSIFLIDTLKKESDQSILLIFGAINEVEINIKIMKNKIDFLKKIFLIF